jgi:uroporphyrinogen-III synthase
MHMKNLQVVFGDLMNRSAYDQYAALLNTTPSTIRAFGPRAEAARGMTLLTIKAIAFGPGLETGAFSFELPHKHGFQIGDPQKSRRTDLEVFGMGGHHVEIICTTSKDSVRFSQPELNLILTSLHASVPESSAVPSSRLAALPK